MPVLSFNVRALPGEKDRPKGVKMKKLNKHIFKTLLIVTWKNEEKWSDCNKFKCNISDTTGHQMTIQVSS